MSDTTAGAAPTDPNAAAWPAEQEEHEALIFEQELNEVYLLIDYISGRGDRNLGSLTVPNPNKELEGEPDTLSSGEVVKKLAAMRYPPDPDTPVMNAQNAAVLLLAKDRLTALADPARGYTIAYTKLFADAEKTVAQRFRLSFRRSPHGRARPPQPAGAPADPAGIVRPRRTDTRVTIATMAFPGLQDHARLFRRWRRRLVWIAIVWLVLTVFTYWDAGLARSVLQRLDQNSKSIATTEQANPDLFDDPKCQSLSNWQPATPSGQQPAPASATPRSTEDSKRAFACRTLGKLHDANAAARAELDGIFNCGESKISVFGIVHDIVHVWCWRPLILSGGKMEQAGNGAAAKSPASTAPGAGAIDWQTATSVLLVFTTYILPMMFAFLGTVIGAFRSMLKKIGNSELEPRDLMRMHLGIPTGLVAGVAVGLFLSPSSVPSEGSASVAGELTLTASGLGFLAGYASHSFFAYLDNIVGTIFPNTAPASAPPARPAAASPAATG
ncbi:MAG TPA: hypothetical protein VG308_04010 [Stellaceae bacterium]|jgi:hypothetical protein|nr:hypothetical protein [Stellaceae bacterium]